MSKDVTQQLAERIGDRLTEINPYRQDSKEYWLYEAGLLRGILAQLASRDSHNMDVFIRQVKRIGMKNGE